MSATEILLVFLSGAGDLLSLAVAGACVLWVISRLRKLRSDARIATGMEITSAPAPSRRRKRPEPEAATPAQRSRRREYVSVAVAGTFLGLSTLYVSERWIPQAFQFVELKNQSSRGRAMLLSATWRDQALQCEPSQTLGTQLRQLFESYESYVLRVLWDHFPPRYEVVIVGETRIAKDTPLRRLDMVVDLYFDGDAELRSLHLFGEVSTPETARKLLQEACNRPG